MFTDHVVAGTAGPDLSDFSVRYEEVPTPPNKADAPQQPLNRLLYLEFFEPEEYRRVMLEIGTMMGSLMAAGINCD